MENKEQIRQYKQYMTITSVVALITLAVAIALFILQASYKSRLESMSEFEIASTGIEQTISTLGILGIVLIVITVVAFAISIFFNVEYTKLKKEADNEHTES